MTKTAKKYQWTMPEDGGIPLLCMPNIPEPLHGMAPRTIMGTRAWDKYRQEVYREHQDTCEICGAKLSGKRGTGLPMHHAHEIYNMDYKKRTCTFVRACCLCPTCHSFIHSGRSLAMYLKGVPLWTEEVIIDLASHGFELVQKWNKLHPDDERLKCFQTLRNWREVPELQEQVDILIQQYEIDFYEVPNTTTSKDWGKWKLIYEEVEYYSPYQNKEEWEIAMNGAPTDTPDPFDQKEMENLAELAAQEGIY